MINTQIFIDVYTQLSFYKFLGLMYAANLLLQICTLMIMTKITFKKAYEQLIKTHLYGVGLSFFGAPLMAIWTCWLALWFYQILPSGFVQQSLFVSLFLLMNLYTRHSMSLLLMKFSNNKNQISIMISIVIFAFFFMFTAQQVGFLK